VMLLVGGLDASTAEKCVIVVVIAATVRQVTATRMIFIRQLSDLMRFDMRCLL
jgi:hypothetical protein